jgi:hypothetical protein
MGVTDEEDVATYKDAYSPLWGEPDEKVAGAALAPESVEQVQKVVAIANRFGIPLYTVSTGRNLAYGGSAPVHSGSVVLDLERMNRVREVMWDQTASVGEGKRSSFTRFGPGIGLSLIARDLGRRKPLRQAGAELRVRRADQIRHPLQVFGQNTHASALQSIQNRKGQKGQLEVPSLLSCPMSVTAAAVLRGSHFDQKFTFSIAP